MAYSELIKNFSRIRDYMRDFYIYGFKRREEYDTKSARSYDNERRRIESWLGEYMSFRQDSNGKRVFISIDSRDIVGNPLYKAFKAKSFTTKDILLNFFVLDILSGGVAYTTSEIMDKLEDEYMSAFDAPAALDESTLRAKLREYTTLGLLISMRQGRQLHYALSPDNVPLREWESALAFFSEEDPLGVIGSYHLDKLEFVLSHFRFKHHYILHALESEILCELLSAIDEKRRVEIDIYSQRRGRPATYTITPLKILVSTQGGRRYLLSYAHSFRRMRLYRLDYTIAVKPRDPDQAVDELCRKAVNFMGHLWGVSSGSDTSLDHIEMTIFAVPGEEHIPTRLDREKRGGTVESLGEGLYRFRADVYDAVEMLPWLRTFIGRVITLECSNKYVRETFLSDLRAMESMYLGGKSDAIS